MIMTKEYYSFGVDTKARLYTETSGMNGKRFYMDKSGDLYDKENGLLMLDFGYSYDGVNCKRIIDLLNELNDENNELKEILGAILLEVKRDITNTNQTGEITVFINPNKFNLISEVLRKYGALKEWYE